MSKNFENPHPHQHPLNDYTKTILLRIKTLWSDWNAHARELRADGDRDAEAEVFEACMAHLDELFQQVQFLSNHFAPQFTLLEIVNFINGLNGAWAASMLIDHFPSGGFVCATGFDPLAHSYMQVLTMTHGQVAEQMQDLIDEINKKDQRVRQAASELIGPLKMNWN